MTRAWWAWVVPAFAIAFSIDAGQIAISVELRNGERTRWKYIAFVILAIATYFLQWLYLIAHVPMIPLGTGVAAQHATLVAMIRDFAIWVVPGLLPISTVLYTFGYAPVRRAKATAKPVPPPAMPMQSPAKQTAIVPLQKADDLTIEMPDTQSVQAVALAFPIVCPDCNWHGEYGTQRAATNALTAHRRHAHAELQNKR